MTPTEPIKDGPQPGPTAEEEAASRAPHEEWPGLDPMGDTQEHSSEGLE